MIGRTCISKPREIPTLYYLLIGVVILIFARTYRKWKASDNRALVNRTFWHFFFPGRCLPVVGSPKYQQSPRGAGKYLAGQCRDHLKRPGDRAPGELDRVQIPKIPLAPVYVLLIGTCLGLYFVDLARFGFLPYPTKAFIVGTLTQPAHVISVGLSSSARLPLQKTRAMPWAPI